MKRSSSPAAAVARTRRTRPLVAFARTLADDLGVPVFATYLEMAEPTIPAALRAATDGGAERLVLLPFFLSPGMHVRRPRDLSRSGERSDTDRARSPLMR